MRAETMLGHEINDKHITPYNEYRWLQHDWQKLKPQPAGQDTRVAWSDGCIILPTKKHTELSELFIDKGLKPNDVIMAEIIDIDTEIPSDTEEWKKVLAKPEPSTVNRVESIINGIKGF
jgi:hypothetical protein